MEAVNMMNDTADIGPADFEEVVMQKSLVNSCESSPRKGMITGRPKKSGTIKAGAEASNDGTMKNSSKSEIGIG